jgi:hypothetical protein
MPLKIENRRKGYYGELWSLYSEMLYPNVEELRQEYLKKLLLNLIF